MGRIDDLIQELCPDGVEYKNIERLCAVSRGRVISKDYLNNYPGIYQFILRKRKTMAYWDTLILTNMKETT